MMTLEEAKEWEAATDNLINALDEFMKETQQQYLTIGYHIKAVDVRSIYGALYMQKRACEQFIENLSKK